jgi:hypothetical protein
MSDQLRQGTQVDEERILELLVWKAAIGSCVCASCSSSDTSVHHPCLLLSTPLSWLDLSPAWSQD